MARQLNSYDDPPDYSLDDWVWFDAMPGVRLRGKVTRVYNSRSLYHVETHTGERYEVQPGIDNMSRAG